MKDDPEVQMDDSWLDSRTYSPKGRGGRSGSSRYLRILVIVGSIAMLVGALDPLEGSGVVKNPHDPEAQWAAKDTDRKTAWIGYKAQIAETVPEDQACVQSPGEPTSQFITAVLTTEAISSDLDGRERLEQQQEQHGLGRADTLYVDAAYVTDDTLALDALRQVGHKGGGFLQLRHTLDWFRREHYLPGDLVQVKALLSRGGTLQGTQHISGGGPITDASVRAFVAVPSTKDTVIIPLCSAAIRSAIF
jgi:hypothetical protein